MSTVAPSPAASRRGCPPPVPIGVAAEEHRHAARGVAAGRDSEPSVFQMRIATSARAPADQDQLVAADAGTTIGQRAGAAASSAPRAGARRSRRNHCPDRASCGSEAPCARSRDGAGGSPSAGHGGKGATGRSSSPSSDGAYPLRTYLYVHSPKRHPELDLGSMREAGTQGTFDCDATSRMDPESSSG